MKDLVERLEAGETGREMDAEIACVFRIGESGIVIDDPRCTFERDGAKVIAYAGNVRIATMMPHPFTTSLDAAIALVERVFPMAGWALTQHPNTKTGAELFEKSPDRFDELREHNKAAGFRVFHSRAFAPTPAAALIAALLRAKDAP